MRKTMFGRIRYLGLLPLAALWLAVAAPAPAMAAPVTCTSNASLGALGPPASVSFGKSYDRGAIFSDCWQFSIAAPADATGTTTETNASFWFLPRYIDVLTVALYNPLTLEPIAPGDWSPGSFGFTGLLAGNYGLAIAGYTSLGFGTASYSATLTTTASRVSSVPEPSTLALLALALFGLAFSRGRLQRR